MARSTSIVKAIEEYREAAKKIRANELNRLVYVMTAAVGAVFLAAGCRLWYDYLPPLDRAGFLLVLGLSIVVMSTIWCPARIEGARW
jgi:hypothetical protein